MSTALLFFSVDFDKIAEVLIKNGAEIEARDHKGYTPLYLAAFNGNLVGFLWAENFEKSFFSAGKETVAELLIKNGADVNSRDDKDCPVLNYAAQKRIYQISFGIINRIK